MAECPKIEPRRLFDDDNPTGYLESDQDYVLNNLDAAVWLLDNALKRTTRPDASDFYREAR